MNVAKAGKGNIILSVALGVQLVLAGTLFWQSSEQGNFSSAQSIAGFDIDSADSLVIEDSESELTLARIGDRWQVNSDSAIPADTQAVINVLESLSDLQAGLPVASSASSQAQLEVADDKYQRRLTVKQGDEQLVQMYLGTSPGFRKSHIRLAGEQAIHAAKINVYDFHTSEDRWLDKQVLAFDEVNEIAGDGYAVRKQDNTWSIVEPGSLQESHVVNASVADNMIDSLEQLRVTGIHYPDQAQSAADTTDEAANGLTELQFTVQVEDKPVVLSLVKQGEMIYAERDDREGRFVVTGNVFDKFSEFTLESLLLEENDASVN